MSVSSSQVITRFAPSPTGLLHVGNGRTALINWLYARAQGGKFILRIDDTDQERSKAEYEEGIKKDLAWLGIDWDETFKQSERLARYREAKERLIAMGRLYPCYESQEELAIKKKSLLNRNLPPIYDRAALRLTAQQKEQLESDGVLPHWRFLLEDEEIIWRDLIRGEMRFHSQYLNDPILFKSDGTMTYTLASVVDDIDYNISHIIRGEDHLSNSATHLQIFKALGAKQVPNLAHICLLYNKDQEISKRVGGFDIQALRNKGLDYMTINSFLAKVGTSDAISYYLRMNDLISSFDLAKFGKAPVHYDVSDLEKLNQKLIHHLPYTLAAQRLSEQEIEGVDEVFWESVKYNINLLPEIMIWSNICNKVLEPVIIDADLCKIAAELLLKDSSEQSEWSYHKWIEEIKKFTDKSGKVLFAPIRLAITGLQDGPELRYIIPMLGFKRAYARLCGQKA